MGPNEGLGGKLYIFEVTGLYILAPQAGWYCVTYMYSHTGTKLSAGMRWNY